MMQASDSCGDLKTLGDEPHSPVGVLEELEDFATDLENQELHFMVDQIEKPILSRGYSQLGFAKEEGMDEEASFGSQDGEDEAITRIAKAGYLRVAGDSPPASPSVQRTLRCDLKGDAESTKLVKSGAANGLPSLVEPIVRRSAKSKKSDANRINESRCTTHHSHWIGFNVFFIAMGMVILLLKSDNNKLQFSAKPFAPHDDMDNFHFDANDSMTEQRYQGTASVGMEQAERISEEDFEMIEAKKILERIASPEEPSESISDNARPGNGVTAASVGSRHSEEMVSPIIELGGYKRTDGILFTGEIEKYCNDEDDNPNFFIPKCLELCQPSECCFNSDISCSLDLVGCDPYVMCGNMLDYTNFARGEVGKEGRDEHY